MRNLMLNFLCLAVTWACISASCQQASHAATLIHAGRFIDGRADALRTEVTLVIDEGKIQRVEAGYAKPASGDQLIDLREYCVMPA